MGCCSYQEGIDCIPHDSWVYKHVLTINPFSIDGEITVGVIINNNDWLVV